MLSARLKRIHTSSTWGQPARASSLQERREHFLTGRLPPTHCAHRAAGSPQPRRRRSLTTCCSTELRIRPVVRGRTDTASIGTTAVSFWGRDGRGVRTQPHTAPQQHPPNPPLVARTPSHFSLQRSSARPKSDTSAGAEEGAQPAQPPPPPPHFSLPFAQSSGISAFTPRLPGGGETQQPLTRCPTPSRRASRPPFPVHPDPRSLSSPALLGDDHLGLMLVEFGPKREIVEHHLHFPGRSVSGQRAQRPGSGTQRRGSSGTVRPLVQLRARVALSHRRRCRPISAPRGRSGRRGSVGRARPQEAAARYCGSSVRQRWGAELRSPRFAVITGGVPGGLFRGAAQHGEGGAGGSAERLQSAHGRAVGARPRSAAHGAPVRRDRLRFNGARRALRPPLPP